MLFCSFYEVKTLPEVIPYLKDIMESYTSFYFEICEEELPKEPEEFRSSNTGDISFEYKIKVKFPGEYFSHARIIHCGNIWGLEEFW